MFVFHSISPNRKPWELRLTTNNKTSPIMEVERSCVMSISSTELSVLALPSFLSMSQFYKIEVSLFIAKRCKVLSKTNKAVNVGQFCRRHLFTILYIWQKLCSFDHVENGTNFLTSSERKEVLGPISLWKRLDWCHVNSRPHFNPRSYKLNNFVFLFTILNFHNVFYFKLQICVRKTLFK